MIKLSKAVIVEGKYDKIKLANILDAVIITTDGFGIFKNREKSELIRAMAKSTGVVILTDSDTAGFKIRGYLKGCINEGEIINVYIPQIRGKERRKEKQSAEGYLGVEGLSEEILLDAFNKAGVTASKAVAKAAFLTKLRLMEDGLSGGENSATLRRELLRELGLPTNLSANAAIDIINSAFSEGDYTAALERVAKR